MPPTPTVNFSQRTHTGDPAALARGVRHLERLTAVRTVLQAATLAAMVWALAAATNPSSRPPEPPSPPPGRRTPTAGPTEPRYPHGGHQTSRPPVRRPHGEGDWPARRPGQARYR